MSWNAKYTQRSVRAQFEKEPHCPRCKVLMILPEALPGHKIGKIKVWPKNVATFEHTHSKHSLQRGTGRNKNTILCWGCNNDIANKEHDLTIHLGRLLSGYPAFTTKFSRTNNSNFNAINKRQRNTTKDSGVLPPPMRRQFKTAPPINQ